jgi:hypothetical protein
MTYHDQLKQHYLRQTRNIDSNEAQVIFGPPWGVGVAPRIPDLAAFEVTDALNHHLYRRDRGNWPGISLTFESYLFRVLHDVQLGMQGFRSTTMRVSRRPPLTMSRRVKRKFVGSRDCVSHRTVGEYTATQFTCVTTVDKYLQRELCLARLFRRPTF